MSNDINITSILTERILRIESLLADNRSLETPGNYASGGVLFGSTGGKAGVDSTNFVWDNTNKRLGIGINAPGAKLHIKFTGGSLIGAQIEQISASGDTLLDLYNSDNTSGSGSNFLLARTAATIHFRVRGDGLIASSGLLQLGGVAVSRGAALATIANNGVVALSGQNFGFLFVHVSGSPGVFAINGTVHTVNEWYDPSASFSAVAGTAGGTNVYWSAGNNRYEIENKRGSTLNHRMWFLDAA